MKVFQGKFVNNPVSRLREFAPFEVELESDLIARLRPLQPGDQKRAQQAYQHLSGKSRLNRFWQNTMHLSPELAAKLTDTDDTDHLGWIALGVGGNEAIPGHGAASLWRKENGSDTAEFAMTVLDDWQRLGFGALLFSILWHEAWQVGVRRFEGVARRDNDAMLSWWDSVGGTVVETTMQYELELKLEEPEDFVNRIEFDLHAGKVAVEIANWFRYFSDTFAV